jgi:hypothetical protein
MSSGGCVAIDEKTVARAAEGRPSGWRRLIRGRMCAIRMWKVVTRHEIFGFFSPKRVLPSSGHPHTVKITPTGLKLHPQHENYTHRQ